MRKIKETTKRLNCKRIAASECVENAKLLVKRIAVRYTTDDRACLARTCYNGGLCITSSSHRDVSACDCVYGWEAYDCSESKTNTGRICIAKLPK